MHCNKKTPSMASNYAFHFNLALNFRGRPTLKNAPVHVTTILVDYSGQYPYVTPTNSWIPTYIPNIIKCWLFYRNVYRAHNPHIGCKLQPISARLSAAHRHVLTNRLFSITAEWWYDDIKVVVINVCKFVLLLACRS